MTTTDVNPIRRIEVIATELDDVESEALAEAASTFPHLLVTGIEEIEHKGGSRYQVAVNTRPKKRSQQPRRQPVNDTNTKKQIGPRDDMDHLQWAAIDLGILCPHCGGDGSVGLVKGKVASAIAGTNSGRGHLLKQLEDPPLSTVRRVAKILNTDVGAAVKWLGQLRAAEKRGSGK